MALNYSEELVYSKTVSAHGNYKYLRIVPVGTGQNITLSLSSTTQTQFELPNNVMNLSKSKLCFDLLVPRQGSLLKFNNIYANALSLIDRITLTSRSGVILVDIPNTATFGNLISSVNTQLSDLLTRTPLPTNVNLPEGTTATDVSPTHVDTTASNTSAITASQLIPISDLIKCNGTVNQ